MSAFSKYDLLKLIMTILLGMSFSFSPCSGGVQIHEVQSWNRSTLEDVRGEYPDWIELWNSGSEAVSLHGLFLSDERFRLKYPLPAVELEGNGYYFVFASGDEAVGLQNHAGFSIDADGEPVFLLDAAGRVIDEVMVPESMPDISHGRLPEGGEDFFYFAEPTPGQSNSTEAFAGITAPPKFSSRGGFVEQAERIAVSHPDPDALIWFSADGRNPPDKKYEPGSTIHVYRSMVLRARAQLPGFLPSRTIVRTFLLGEERLLPVICISTDPNNLFSKEYGIFWGPNVWQDWEYPAWIEFYETSGDLVFENEAGLSLHGSSARLAPIRPFRLSFRKDYGMDWLEYPILPDIATDRFKRLVLRNAGNDYNDAYLRDALMSRLVIGTNIDRVGYQPVVTFINGQFWALYNLREKVDEYLFSERCGMDPEAIDVIERESTPKAGDANAYRPLAELFESVTGEDPVFYEAAKSLMDIDNFIDYQIAQIYCGNLDSAKNRRLWRPRKDGARWRWLLNDTDAGFGGFGAPEFGQAVQYIFSKNMFEFATKQGANVWPDYDWNTLFLRKLLMQTEFREAFLVRLSDLLNREFHPDRVLAVIDELSTAIAPFMERHFHKWRAPGPESWEEDVEVLRVFGRGRAENLRGHALDFFGLSGLCRVTIRQRGNGEGRIRMNSILLEREDLPWSGYVFKGIRLQLEVLPDHGSQMVGWDAYDGENHLEIIPETEVLDFTAGIVSEQPRIISMGISGAEGIVWLEFEGPLDSPEEYRVEGSTPGGQTWKTVDVESAEVIMPHKFRLSFPLDAKTARIFRILRKY